MLYHKLACVVAFAAGGLANPGNKAKGNGVKGATAQLHQLLPPVVAMERLV